MVFGFGVSLRPQVVRFVAASAAGPYQLHLQAILNEHTLSGYPQEGLLAICCRPQAVANLAQQALRCDKEPGGEPLFPRPRRTPPCACWPCFTGWSRTPHWSW